MASLYTGRHQIDQGEDKHPHQVHKVPIQTAYFHVLRLELAAAHGKRDNAQVDQADDDVSHVQSREREKRAAEQRHSPGVAEGCDMLVRSEEHTSELQSPCN